MSDLVPGEVVAIDGKTVRRSHDRNAGQRAIHLVSAWASANTLTLGQVKTEEKSNEITAIPQLLRMLELKGCIVTIDAMGCQQEIAQGILDRGADYVLSLKENQGQLYADVRDRFEGAAEFGFEGVPHDYATTLNKDHGRIERRECWTISDPCCLEYLSAGQDWPGLRSVVKVVGRRATPEGTTVQPRYYISSLGGPSGAPAGGGAHSLEHREPLALEPGRDFWGRPLPDPQGPRSAEHGDAAAGFAQSAQERNQPEGGHPGEAPPGRLEGGLPAKSPTQLKRDCPAVVVAALSLACAREVAEPTSTGIPNTGTSTAAAAASPPAARTAPSAVPREPVATVNLDEIKEQAVRDLFDDRGRMVNPDQRLARIAAEHKGGFGGYYFDETDRSTAYVYMLDPSQTEAAKAAFRAAYRGDRQVDRIIPVQGDYAFNDLLEWFHVLGTAMVENGIHPSTGLDFVHLGGAGEDVGELSVNCGWGFSTVGFQPSTLYKS